MIDTKSAQKLFEFVLAEMEHARKKHRPLNSSHEAHSVILEEFEEWWYTVKVDKPSSEELIQVAAMALLTIMEVGPWPVGAWRLK